MICIFLLLLDVCLSRGSRHGELKNHHGIWIISRKMDFERHVEKLGRIFTEIVTETVNEITRSTNLDMESIEETTKALQNEIGIRDQDAPWKSHWAVVIGGKAWSIGADVQVDLTIEEIYNDEFQTYEKYEKYSQTTKLDYNAVKAVVNTINRMNLIYNLQYRSCHNITGALMQYARDGVPGHIYDRLDAPFPLDDLYRLASMKNWLRVFNPIRREPVIGFTDIRALVDIFTPNNNNNNNRPITSCIPIIGLINRNGEIMTNNNNRVTNPVQTFVNAAININRTRNPAPSLLNIFR